MNFKEHQIPAEKAGKSSFAMVRSVPKKEKSVGTMLMCCALGWDLWGFFSSLVMSI